VNLLVVTTSYPRHRDDPAGSFVAARVDELRAQGHVVDVVSAGGEDDLFRGAGAPERFDETPARAWVAAVRYFAQLVERLRPRIGDCVAVAPDAVETHWLVPSALAVVLLGWRGPHRAQAHSGDVALLETMPLGAQVATRLATADLELVFASGDLRARFARLVERAGNRAAAARVLAAPIVAASSPLLRAPAPRPPREERWRRARARGVEPPVVLAVGRLVPIKAHDRLVRAVARLPATARGTIVILGEGPLRQRLERLAHDRRLELRLPGAVPSSVVAEWLALADVFVHPSRVLPSGRSEGLPVAVREALAAGVPTIATATGGLGALAEHGARLALLADAPAPQLLPALAEALGSFLL
jgi:glycosyltransferase involved in cell wall biosynthesis